MSKRRPGTPSLSMQLDILFARGLVICAECGEVIERRQDCEWDHTHEWADGGAHEIDNLRPIHNKKTIGCHKRKSAKAERDRHHIDRLAKSRLAIASMTAPAALVQTVNPGERCRGCGEYKPCSCRQPVRRSAFQGARRVRRGEAT